MRFEEYIKNYITSKKGIEHAYFVKNTSLKIFKDLKKILPDNTLLNFENSEKLITYCALLHDIGNFFTGLNSLKPHNKTGAKLVLENGIEDLKENELKIVAASIRYHRGSKPKEARHRLYSSLAKADRNKVLVISSLIRLADALDRGHMQTAENIVFKYDFDTRTLTLNTDINIMFNKGIKQVFDKKKTLFEDVFKVKVCLCDE